MVRRPVAKSLYPVIIAACGRRGFQEASQTATDRKRDQRAERGRLRLHPPGRLVARGMHPPLASANWGPAGVWPGGHQTGSDSV